MKEFIKNFANQFDDTDLSEFQPDTRFRELEEWSSLAALSVMAMIDEEYNVQINGNDMRNALTIGDLYNIVKNKMR